MHVASTTEIRTQSHIPGSFFVLGDLDFARRFLGESISDLLLDLERGFGAAAAAEPVASEAAAAAVDPTAVAEPVVAAGNLVSPSYSTSISVSFPSSP